MTTTSLLTSDADGGPENPVGTLAGPLRLEGTVSSVALTFTLMCLVL